MEVCKGEGWLFKYIITGFFAKRRNIPFSTSRHPWSNGKVWSSLRPESLQWIKDSWNSQHCGVNATTGKPTLLLMCLIKSDQDGIVTIVQPLWKTLTVLEKATSTRRVKQSEKKEGKQSFSAWPCNSIPSHPPREVKTYVHAKTCPRMFLVAWFASVRKWKPSTCPSAGEWIHYRGHLYTVEHYRLV